VVSERGGAEGGGTPVLQESQYRTGLTTCSSPSQAATLFRNDLLNMARRSSGVGHFIYIGNSKFSLK
jgi:hypothetical protein